VTTRNNLDHGDWELPPAIVGEVDGRVTVTEPSIEATPVTRWVADMTTGFYASSRMSSPTASRRRCPRASH